MANLKTISKRFGLAYAKSKEFDTKKENLKKLMFAAFDEELEKKQRRQLLVTYSEGDPVGFVAKNYPGWRLVDDHETQIVIEEDPKFMKFSYLNPDTNMVFGRTVVDPGPSLDDERLREEDPEFWEAITEWPEPWYSLIKNYAELWNIDQELGSQTLDEHLNGYLSTEGLQRTLKSPEDWTEEQFSKIQEYMVPGKITTRLLSPREATKEELEELE